MERRQDNILLQSERADFKLREPIIEEKLKDFFLQTALVEKRPFTQTDIETLHQAYLDVAPFAYNKLYPNFWEHCLYSSILARKIAEKVGSDELEPLEAEALAFIGDDGSIAVPHRYARKNIINDILDKDIGIRRELLAKQPPVLKIIGLRVFKINNQEAESIDDFTLPQIILDVADNLGKINQDGNPRTVDQANEYAKNQPQTYAGGIFPSEKAGLRALTEKGKQQFAIGLLLDEIKYLFEVFGVDVNELIQLAYQEYLSENNQDWLLNIKQSQETLDPTVDKTLGRLPIQTVVFDAGGVLMKDSDPALFRALADYFDCSYEEIVAVMDELNPDAFSNKISEEEYLKKFWARIGRQYPGQIDEARKLFTHPEIYQVIDGMQEIVEGLSNNPDVQLYVLSDSIHVVTPPVISWIRENYPQIPLENILISSNIGASKRDRGCPAFKKILERLREPEPETIVFIDYKEPYTTIARAGYGIRSIRFAVNDPSRLRLEFEKARLI